MAAVRYNFQQVSFISSRMTDLMLMTGCDKWRHFATGLAYRIMEAIRKDIHIQGCPDFFQYLSRAIA
jgi:hypothetical protein